MEILFQAARVSALFYGRSSYNNKRHKRRNFYIFILISKNIPPQVPPRV